MSSLKNSSSLTINLTKREQKELTNMFDENEIKGYFNHLHKGTSDDCLMFADIIYNQDQIDQISEQIQSGTIEVKHKSDDVNEYLMPQRISKEEYKALELKIQKQQIELQLQYLNSQIHGRSPKKSQDQNNVDKINFSKKYVLSKQEHASFIEKSLLERQTMDKKHKALVEKLEFSRIKAEQVKKQKQQKRIKARKEKRRNTIEKNLKQKKQLHEALIAQELKSRKVFNQMKKKKFLHQEIEQRYESEHVLPSLEEKKRKLKQIREIRKNFDVENLKKHQKSYLEQRNKMLQQQSRVQEEWHYKAPAKSENLAKILEDQKVQLRKKLEEKKRKLQQKLNRQQNYVSYLRQGFPPRAAKKKRLELIERIQRTTTHRRQASLDGKTLGISYLQQIKKHNKKTIQPKNKNESQKQKSFASTSDRQKQAKTTDYLLEMKKKQKNYSSLKKYQLQKLINSNGKSSEKISKLEIESQKLKEAFKRKQQMMKVKNDDLNVQEEALDILISDIRTKMSIVNTYKKNEQPYLQ